MGFKKIFISVGCVVSAIIVLILLLNCFVVVPPSHKGVVVLFGDVKEEQLDEGVHFVNPFAKVIKVTTQIQTAVAKDASASSKDLQNIVTTITVNYNVNPQRVRFVYLQNPQLNYEHQYLLPAIHEAFKSVTSRYTVDELVTKRAEVSEQINIALNDKIKRYNLDIVDINITEFSFSDVFDKAIEAKMEASQKALKAKADLERVKYEADQVIVKAKADAEAIRIQTKAIAESGGENYVKLKQIEKWDGRLPNYMGNVPMIFNPSK